MAWRDKAIELVKKYGEPAKFAAKLVLGATLPGGSVAVDLVCKAIDCAHGAARDQWDLSDADSDRVSTILETLSGDLSSLMAAVAPLQALPDQANSVLNALLATDGRVVETARKLETVAFGLERVEAAQQQVLRDVGFGKEMLVEMQPMLRRLGGIANYFEELHALRVAPADFAGLFRDYKNAQRDFLAGRPAEARARLRTLTRAQPRLATAHVALATAQAAEMDFAAADQSLATALALRPDDVDLLDLRTRVTRMTGIRGGTGTATSSSKPDAPLKPGDHLGGWLLEQVLGRGGMGIVFKARKADRVAALKVMLPALTRQPALSERFRREIMALCRLPAHPNLVRIGDFDHVDDVWYLVMELVEGLSLEARLDQQGPLTVGEAIELFRPIAGGLAAAHAQGIHHRDIKPQNIILKTDGTPVLVDFGLASVELMGQRTITGEQSGMTVMFAPPEQRYQARADARSDVWSLAATMWYSIKYDQPARRAPDAFRVKHAPDELRDLLDKALDADPEDRLQTAAELAEALNAETTVLPRVSEPDELEWDTVGDDLPEELTSSIGMKLKRIPKGSFVMGDEEDSNNPPHRVTLSRDLYMGMFPVTNAQYRRYKRDHDSGYGFNADDQPVVRVSWDDAVAFCRWLTKTERSGGRIGADDEYDLPTEAEWEHACRAGRSSDASKYPWGEHWPPLGTDGNYSNGIVGYDGGKGATSPVGSYAPNPWGLFDMGGNVWEWCADWHDREACKADATDPTGPETGSSRVLRGASWGSSDRGGLRYASVSRDWSDALASWGSSDRGGLRSAYRNGSGPTFADGHDGFRLVCRSGPVPRSASL